MHKVLVSESNKALFSLSVLQIEPPSLGFRGRVLPSPDALHSMNEYLLPREKDLHTNRMVGFFPPLLFMLPAAVLKRV